MVPFFSVFFFKEPMGFVMRYVFFYFFAETKIGWFKPKFCGFFCGSGKFMPYLSLYVRDGVTIEPAVSPIPQTDLFSFFKKNRFFFFFCKYLIFLSILFCFLIYLSPFFSLFLTLIKVMIAKKKKKNDSLFPLPSL